MKSIERASVTALVESCVTDTVYEAAGEAIDTYRAAEHAIFEAALQRGKSLGLRGEDLRDFEDALVDARWYPA